MTDSTSRFEAHIKITDNDTTAVDWLATTTGLSKSHIKQVMNKGAVWLTHGKHTKRLRRATRNLPSGDTLHMYYDEKVLAMESPIAELVADEGAYSIWYKPFGMLSQGSKWGDHCAINRYVEQTLKPQRPGFVVHRLDRAATGLILIAHEKKIAAKLTELFKNRTIEKRYRVIVHGNFPEDEQYLDTAIEGKTAISHAKLLDYDKQQDTSLLEISIETGRKHQIRIHLSSAGFPIVGDRLYGDTGKEKDKHKDLQLTAFALAFQCPVSHKSKQFRLSDDKMPNLQG